MRYAKVTLSGVSDTQTIQPASGELAYVRITYTNGNAAGDLTITDLQTGLVFLTITNSATDFSAPLLQQAKDPTGTAITGFYEEMPITGGFTIASAQHNSNTSILVEIWWECN